MTPQNTNPPQTNPQQVSPQRAGVDPAVAEELATANSILFSQGVVDAFGHVSVRCQDRPDHFLIASSMAPALVTAADIMRCDQDGNGIDDPRPTYLERFIHAEIYRARPDVQAVVHSHSPTVVSFSIASQAKLRPVCHTCGFLGQESPVFEIRKYADAGSDLLIRNAQLGRNLAAELGANAVVLMRGHGSTVVGSSLRQAVFRAVFTEQNARIQSEAQRLGGVVYLTPEEAASSVTTTEVGVNRAWDLWALTARRWAR